MYGGLELVEGKSGVAITQFRGGVVKRGLRRIARVFHLISDALRQSPEDICIMYYCNAAIQ